MRGGDWKRGWGAWQQVVGSERSPQRALFHTGGLSDLGLGQEPLEGASPCLVL